MSNKAIGIFDSGVGGISVAKSIRQRLPTENLLYYADTYHSPYGEKHQALLLERGRYICDFFIEQNAKLIVVACNTATVSILPQLRNEFNIPFVGVEPGIKPASQLTKTGRIAVLATEYTVKSQQLEWLVKRYAGTCQVELQACPGFVEKIENQQVYTRATEALVRKYLEPLLKCGIDTFVLGCTHYVFLLPIIRRVTGESVNIVQTQDAVADQVVNRLGGGGVLKRYEKGGIQFYGSKLNEESLKLCQKLFMSN